MTNEDAAPTLKCETYEYRVGMGILEDASRLKKMLRDSKSRHHNDKLYILVAPTNSNQA